MVRFTMMKRKKRVTKLERVTSDIIKSPDLTVAVNDIVQADRTRRTREMAKAGIVSISEFAPFSYDLERKVTKPDRQVVSYLSDLVYDKEHDTVLIHLSNPSMGIMKGQYLDLGPDPWAKTFDGVQVIVRFTDPRTGRYGELTYDRHTKTIVRYRRSDATKKDESAVED
jgi:hypothetical protein